jgi:hypothetical protein
MKEMLKHALVTILTVWVLLLILDMVGQSGLFFHPYTYFTKGPAQANA